MLYKFKSKAAADVPMLGPNGDAVLRAFGREPSAQGIVDVAALPAAIAAIEAAIADEEMRRAEAEAQAAAEGRKLAAREAIGLRQRAWPLLEMMRRAQAAGEPVTWGA